MIKVITCNTVELGHHTWLCRCCGFLKIVYHTCKSRFCSSCGKKATDQWVKTHIVTLPNVPWQHITFTLPSELWDFFWINRPLLNRVAPIPANIMTELAKQKKIIPGIFMAIHTFGRDLKRNVHFHLSITLCGLSLDKKKWLSNRVYFHHDAIKKMWRSRVLKILQKAYDDGHIKCPKTLKQIKTSADFATWLGPLYKKKWVVHLSKPSANHHQNVKYLGRYLKRPPMSEARILSYDGNSVTYCYQDHQEKKQCSLTLPVFEFIKRLITHIPDLNFRMIRYYSWLSNRTRGKMLPTIYAFLRQDSSALNKANVSWRALHIKTFGIDPLLCPTCQRELELYTTSFAQPKIKLLEKHGDLVSGKCC